MPATPCVTATATVTLGRPKTGLLRPAQAGELYVADIGIPPGVYQQFGISAAGLFHRSQIVAVPTARHPNPPAV